MKLREFIEQEIKAERIYCIEDFGDCLEKLYEFDEAGINELAKNEYQDYLDFDIVWADLHIGYYSVWYEIELKKEVTKNN